MTSVHRRHRFLECYSKAKACVADGQTGISEAQGREAGDLETCEGKHRDLSLKSE